jgi:basic amino acid/polyamine antiporter, APA family
LTNRTHRRDAEGAEEAQRTGSDSTSLSTPRPAPSLLRSVGLAGLTAISLNGVIGSGIFVLPATVALYMGPASPVAYVIAAFATTLIVLCFAEAGSRFERTGGPYLYAREAFGSFVGFEVGWMFLLTRLAATAAITNACAAYLGFFWPVLAQGAGRVLAITGLVFGLAALNLIGIRYGAWTVNILTAAKLIPLLLFIAVGLFSADHQAYTLLAVPDLNGLRQASLALIFAFGGFENASVPSEEVKNPTRNLPIALLISIGVTTVVYILIQIVALGTLPELATDKTPLASASRMFLGEGGAAIMALAGILSTTGSTSAVMLVGPRILYAFGEGGQLPRRLARVHPRYRTPHVSVIVFALVTWGIALFGTFAQLVAVSAMARLIFSATTCLAVPVLRRKRAHEASRFIIPGGFVIPVLAAAVSVWLLSGIAQAQAVAGAAALLTGGLLYSIFSARRAKL